jgi:hypothetical protein
VPSKRTVRTRDWRPTLSPYQEYELLTGELVYPVRGYSGYGDGIGKDLTAFIGPEMRHDWAHHRDALLAFWISGESTTRLPWLFASGGPGTRPWAWWELEDHPEPGEDESEAAYLTRLSLWLPGEGAAFRAAAEVHA